MIEVQQGRVGNRLCMFPKPLVQVRPWHRLSKPYFSFPGSWGHGLANVYGALPAVFVSRAYHLISRKWEVATIVKAIDPRTVEFLLRRQRVDLAVEDLLSDTLGKTLLVQRIERVILRQVGLPILSKSSRARLP